MTPEQQAAFVIAQSALLNAKIAAMLADNLAAHTLGEVSPFDQRHFRETIAEYESVLGHNTVLTFFEQTEQR